MTGPQIIPVEREAPKNRAGKLAQAIEDVRTALTASAEDVTAQEKADVLRYIVGTCGHRLGGSVGYHIPGLSHIPESPRADGWACGCRAEWAGVEGAAGASSGHPGGMRCGRCYSGGEAVRHQPQFNLQVAEGAGTATTGCSETRNARRV